MFLSEHPHAFIYKCYDGICFQTFGAIFQIHMAP